MKQSIVFTIMSLLVFLSIGCATSNRICYDDGFCQTKLDDPSAFGHTASTVKVEQCKGEDMNICSEVNPPKTDVSQGYATGTMKALISTGGNIGASAVQRPDQTSVNQSGGGGSAVSGASSGSQSQSSSNVNGGGDCRGNCK